jgi:hypothetical protein
MDQDQKNKVAMFSTVAGYMDKNNGLWSGIPAFVKTVGDLKAGIASIVGDSEKQAVPTTGPAEAKAGLRDPLEELTLNIADQLAALADETGDADLGAKVAVTKSGLDIASGDDLLATARRVSALATANLAGLADYHITAVEVAALDAAINAFAPVKDTPRVTIAGRAGTTAGLPGKIESTRSILRNRLDKMMSRFRKSNPQFFAGYQAARVIVDRGGGGGQDTPTPTPPVPPTTPAK